MSTKDAYKVGIGLALRADEDVTEEIIRYQRTKQASNKLASIMEQIIYPVIQKVMRSYWETVPADAIDDIWQDVYLQVQLDLLQYRFTKHAGLYVLYRGFYRTLDTVKLYTRQVGELIPEELGEKPREEKFYVDDFLSTLDNIDWAYPREICLMACTIIVCGKGKSEVNVKKMLRNTITNGDVEATQHFYNHVIVNLRIALCIASGLWDMEGDIERLDRGNEGSEEDFNHLRNLQGVWGSYNEEVNRCTRWDNCTHSNLVRNRETDK